MKRFEFKKKFIESELPPKNTDVYWIDTNENSTIKDIISIKEYVNGEWKSVLGSGNSGSNTDSSNFVKLDEGVYFLQTSKTQIIPNTTIRSLKLDTDTTEIGSSLNEAGIYTWKDLYEYCKNMYNDSNTLTNAGITDDAEILNKLKDTYKSKYCIYMDLLAFFDYIDFPKDLDYADISNFEIYLKEIEPLFKFKTSYLKIDNTNPNLGSCKIFIYCKDHGTINELDIIIGIDTSSQFTIFRTFVDNSSFKKSINYSLVSAESLANDEETSYTEIIVKSDLGEDIFENQCVYNSITNKIDVSDFEFVGWGNNVTQPVPFLYWIDNYADEKKPNYGIYYRCTPTETPTEISDYMKSNSNVSLEDLKVTKLYLPEYDKCFYLIDNVMLGDIGVGTGEYKECDVATKFNSKF